MKSVSDQQVEGSKGYDNIYLARQPVFDIDLNLWAYELLYRDRLLATNAVFIDKLQATMNVLEGLPLCHDFEGENCSVIINFPSRAVIDQLQKAYPVESTMVQLTDSAYSEEGLIESIQKLKREGYLFSLDNFENIPQHDKICSLADYITIDFISHKHDKIEKLVSACRAKFPQSALIAKRIEDYDDYIFAKDLGFEFFQGFFFKRPKIHSGRKITTSALSKLKILKLLQIEDFDFEDILKELSTDVSIVHRLLVYINSPAMGLRKKVESINEALVIMGLNPLRKWLQIILLTDIKPVEKPHELVLLSAQRANFLELLAIRHNFSDIKDKLFLLGLFSLIDAILDLPKEVLLSQLSLAKELEDPLLGKKSDFLLWLLLVDQCELGNWEDVEKIAEKIGLNTKGMSLIYEEAYHLARAFFQGS